MTIYLKQSTASQEVALGFFVDSTDGNTEETGLTIANTDIKIHKAGATTLANKNSGGATHISNGVYYAVLDATDTDTLGPLVIYCHPSGALAVRVECCVLAANVYDSLIGGGDLLQVDTTQVGGTAQTARDIGASVLLSNGTGTGQISLSSGLVTLAGVTHTGAVIPTVTTTTTATNLTNAPTNGDFTATMKTSIGTAVAASAVASVTGNVGGNVTGSVGSVVGAVGSVTGSVGSVVGAVGSVTGNVGGNVVGSVASVTGNVGGNVAGTVASVVGAVGSVTGLTAADVAAIKAKTDLLTYTVSGQVDANVQYVNDVALQGVGTVGDSWRPV